MSPWLLTTNWWNKRAGSSPRLGRKRVSDSGCPWPVATATATSTVFTMAEHSFDLSAGQQPAIAPLPFKCVNKTSTKWVGMLIPPFHFISTFMHHAVSSFRGGALSISDSVG